MFKYIYWVKKDLFGCFRERISWQIQWNRFERERSHRNVNYSAFHIRDARSIRFEYLPFTSSEVVSLNALVILVFVSNEAYSVSLPSKRFLKMAVSEAKLAHVLCASINSIRMLATSTCSDAKRPSVSSCTYKCIKKRRRSNVVEKFRKVSDSVWFSFEAVIIENTLKEKWTDKNYFYDNYN